MNLQYDAVIVGAGPAGLSAAYKLAQAKKKVLVIESDPQYVGGIARTVCIKNYRFDIGGHRFFTKSKEVEQFWREVLPDDFIERPRSSKIFYKKKFFDYPLRPLQAFFQLGALESIFCVLSYLKAKLSPQQSLKTFEEWVTSRFGRRLFRIFFENYTEKVWGMKCSEISADWASQRIQALSLSKSILSQIKILAVGAKHKSLIKKFNYPRLGPGQLWESCARKFQETGGHLLMGTRFIGAEQQFDKSWKIEIRTHSGEQNSYIIAQHLISSAPLSISIPNLKPPLSDEALQASTALTYRNFITVVLIMKGKSPFSEQWIYIQDPDVHVGRVQNFRSWSPELIPDENHESFGLEYFCWEKDSFWSLSESDLIALARNEFDKIGLGKNLSFVRGHVVKQPKAYPVYDDKYRERVELIRSEVDSKLHNFHFIGRNGTHRYNNQDHAVMTGLLSAKNIISGKSTYDIWQVNQDAEYLEITSMHKTPVNQAHAP